ncbi:MAG: MoaD/ThiS family protein [Myxococcota bacterium]
MSISVRIPTPLRTLTGGKDEVDAEGETVGKVIENLEGNYPGLKARLCDELGGVLRHVNIYVGEEDIRSMEELETSLRDGDEISIVPAIAGGL